MTTNQSTICTPQYPHCPVGHELTSASMRAHIAYQQSTPENRRELWQAFCKAADAYQDHVKQCRQGGQHG